MTTNNRVSIEQQIEMGIRKANNYVAAEPAQLPSVRPSLRGEVLPPAHNKIDLSVTPTATTHVEMRTSAQDRAWGFLIASMPRTFAFSLAVTLLAIVAGGVSLVVGFVILFGTFSIVEIASYIYTLAISAEGTAHFEARQKWTVIKEEQRERWSHYSKLGGE